MDICKEYKEAIRAGKDIDAIYEKKGMDNLTDYNHKKAQLHREYMERGKQIDDEYNAAILAEVAFRERDNSEGYRIAAAIINA